MDLTKYDNEIRALADRLMAARSVNDPAWLRYGAALVTAARQAGDSKLLGFAYYYLAEACFLFNRYELFRKNLLKGMRCQQETGGGALLARSYNMLAIDAMNQGSTDLGLDFLLKALSFAEACGDRYQQGVIHTNIAQVYIRLRQDRTALRHERLGVPLLRSLPREAFCWYNIVMAYCAEGECYLRLGRIEQARKSMGRIQRILASGKLTPADNVSLLTLHCFQTKLYHSDGDLPRRDESLRQLLDSLDKAAAVTDSFDDICEVGSFLLTIDRPELLRRLLERIRPSVAASGVLNLSFRLSELTVQYYQYTGKEAALARALAEYCALSRRMEAERIRAYQNSVAVQTALEELRKKQLAILEENICLIRQAQTDPLTGLSNRLALNRFSEAAFERAYKRQCTLAVCILDIDHFKEFNDTYGHQAGDDCLVQVAQALRHLAEQGAFCARYGGDEFVVLYEGLDDEAVTARAEGLRQAVAELKIPHRGSSVAPYVTISQGIRNSVPSTENRLWDFLFAADSALYHIKKNEKGGILLIHKARISESSFSE